MASSYRTRLFVFGTADREISSSYPKSDFVLMGVRWKAERPWPHPSERKSGVLRSHPIALAQLYHKHYLATGLVLETA
jgi:hypothetical protein